MTQLPEPLKLDEIPEDDRNFEPLPAGTYPLQVIESRIEDTRSGSGQMLTLTLEVLNGPYQGRRIWDRLNIRNQNPDAQRISQQALKALCEQIKIVGILQDSDDLHFKPFQGRVTIEPSRDDRYGPQNRVRYNVNANRPQQQGQPAGRPQQQAAKRPAAQGGGGSGAKPWANPRPQAAAQASNDPNDEIPPF